MSIVIGLNAGITRNGKIIKDGSTCLVRDGNIVAAIPEERLSGIKHDGGYKKSLPFVLKEANLKLAEIDMIVSSSCCEEEIAFTTEFNNVPTISLNHHLSHAYSVYKTSPFRECIVIVVDAGGNVLEKMTNEKWWHFEREQHSYFHASSSGVQLIERDCAAAYDAGIGEIMRAFTYFLGWPSGMLAGNTMAAGKVMPGRCFPNKRIFELQDGIILSPTVNRPFEPLRVAQELIKSILDIDLEPNGVDKYLSSNYFKIANWVQWNIEQALCEKVEYLIQKTGIRNICLAGGVAYNCPTISAIRKNTSARDVYVCWASGDHGQSIGNALFGNDKISPSKPLNQSPYTGGQYSLTKQAAIVLLGEHATAYDVVEPADSIGEIVSCLVEDKIVALFEGRSESGPRALGHRSIISKASSKDRQSVINKIKGRMNFMPIAPMVLEDDLPVLFEEQKCTPYMTETNYPKSDAIVKRYPSAFHKDNSARVQTVTKEMNPRLYEILRKLRLMSGEQVILNTSFNLRGQPIVETPQQAIDTFIKMGINYLFINGLKISKKH